MVLESITNCKKNGKQFAWLIDPDQTNDSSLRRDIDSLADAGIDYIFLGGSLILNQLVGAVKTIKSISKLPVVLFPGSPLQVCREADAILFLSLISGRNPEYLIGNHVVIAPFLKMADIEIIPTGYILVDGGRPTSVSYMSNSQPIPADKPDLAMATAMAGEMLGLKLIYLDAGSGANFPVPEEMIRSVVGCISIPLIVGGGLKTVADVETAYQAGADLAVVGNIAEKDPFVIREMIAVRDHFNTR